ncbi:uncharacterized protein LOC122312720 [Carya illinoinensis]|uniref:uncharacterized protein LOC122312720 n=1 Tax=Carya illinoinensis TaxID=32201 RepID=UPI001C71D010|nr:uncharacterized protein LOC122312720 [Carya illinoinensis]
MVEGPITLSYFLSTATMIYAQHLTQWMLDMTWYVFSFAPGTVFYLMGGSYITRRWYFSKFEDFPRDVK